MQLKKISILGSTGSIGQSTLEVVSRFPHEFQVVALAAKNQIELLDQQIKIFNPQIVALFERAAAGEIRRRHPHLEVLEGEEGLIAIATQGDLVINALSGAIGLKPTLAAICKGLVIGLANKESLVVGGSWLMDQASFHGATILPIDSEHSAIFQCLEGECLEDVNRLILTASGGPFRNFTLETLEHVTLKDALCHPTWNMGFKNTIDSSTLMNKGLEVIEAHYLFGIPKENIDVVIHPQSIVHSLVEFIDGSMIAQLSEPSMTIPIQYAMTYPKRAKTAKAPFDFIKNGVLEFFVPDTEKFPCLKLAYHALQIEKSAPCFLNAANEILVTRFGAGEISWIEIGRKLIKLLEEHTPVAIHALEDLVEVDREARKIAAKS